LLIIFNDILYHCSIKLKINSEKIFINMICRDIEYMTQLLVRVIGLRPKGLNVVHPSIIRRLKVKMEGQENLNLLKCEKQKFKDWFITSPKTKAEIMTWAYYAVVDTDIVGAFEFDDYIMHFIRFILCTKKHLSKQCLRRLIEAIASIDKFAWQFAYEYQSLPHPRCRFR
jgi:hypothetical protein